MSLFRLTWLKLTFIGKDYLLDVASSIRLVAVVLVELAVMMEVV